MNSSWSRSSVSKAYLGEASDLLSRDRELGHHNFKRSQIRQNSIDFVFQSLRNNAFF